MLLHALALWGWHVKLPFDLGMLGQPTGSISVRLAPAEGAPPAPPPGAPASQPSRQILASAASSASPSPAIASPASPAAPAARAHAAPRVLSSDRPSAAAAPRQPAPAAIGDLSAYIEARRRAREPQPAAAPAPQSAPDAAPAPSAADAAQQRDNLAAAEKLGLNRTPSFGNESYGGGVFQVWRVGRDDAEFGFYGWNKAIRRNSMQMIEVQRGAHPSIELAIVRRMIEIIRERSSGNFEWDSKRLHRQVVLSARPEDNAGLEDFLMREFFEYNARAR